MRSPPLGRVAVLAVAGMLSPLLAVPPVGGAGEPADRPNVLVIVTDDQREAGTLRRRFLPDTLKWFRDGGTRYVPAFVSDPVCCPSRATILSGQYPHNHGVLKNDSGPDGAAALNHEHTVQRALDDAGYRTGLMGKFLNQWSVHLPPPHFDQFSLMEGHGYHDQRFNLNGTVKTIPRYSTSFIADRSVQFIEQAEASDDTPWFLYVAPYTPHLSKEQRPVEAPYRGVPVGDWNGNPAVREADRGDKPPYVQDSNLGLAAGRDRRVKQLRLLMSADDLVEEILAATATNGELDDTIAIFVSDNGFNWAEHGLGGKGVPYTPSIRVPLFLRWPAGGVPAGEVDARMASNVDIAPTIFDAAGVAPGYTVDGRSLLRPWTRDRVHLESWPSPGSPAPRWASTRTTTYQYVEYYDEDGNVTFTEYYDLVTDRWQLTNVLAPGNPADDPADLPLLQARLAADRTCSGAGPPNPCP